MRKYKKVKLEDFSQQTCISIRYLYAIENNNYNALPAAVFVRGYIHQYCKTLNLDPFYFWITFEPCQLFFCELHGAGDDGGLEIRAV